MKNSRHHGPKEYCGVFGVYGHPEAARLAYYGLYALQHRGQESAGIVVSDGHVLRDKRGMGLVPDLFSEYLYNSLDNIYVFSLVMVTYVVNLSNSAIF